jgi:ribosomal-protein-alanine N-acetyltransferase
MELPSPIMGRRVMLRTLVAPDATAAYLGWLADPEVARFLEVRFNPPGSLPELAAYVDQVHRSPVELLLAICLIDGGAHVGNIKLGPIDRNHGRGDIGFFIGERSQWGKGLASDAIEQLSDHALAQMGLEKVTAGCYASNEGSRRALTRAGFVEEARLPSHWISDGRREDGLLFGKHAPIGPRNWPASPSAAAAE